MGDHINDYDSVQDLEITKNNIIGIGFVNIKPEIMQDETKKDIISRTWQQRTARRLGSSASAAAA